MKCGLIWYGIRLSVVKFFGWMMGMLLVVWIVGFVRLVPVLELR